jgi:hypothetical protein
MREVPSGGRTDCHIGDHAAGIRCGAECRRLEGDAGNEVHVECFGELGGLDF